MESDKAEIQSGGPGAAAGPGPGILTGLAGFHPDALLAQADLAEALGVCGRTLRRMVMKSELPPPVPLGGRKVWLAGRVRDWLRVRAERAEKDAARSLAKIHNLSP